MERTASFSRDRRYRYALGRRWGEGPTLTWVMLNPSMADHRRDDPTIRRCIRFSEVWGFDALRVVNLFALCSPEPQALLVADNLFGPRGERALREALRPSTGGSEASAVIAAWGNVHPRLAARAERVRALLPEGTWCLGITGRGEPRHPLYLRGDARPAELAALAATLSVFRAAPTMAA